MSAKTSEHIKTVRIVAKDETTSIMLGISRTMGGMRREISALRMMLRLLADDEFMAALAAGELGEMLQIAIPIIGIAAGLISMLVGMRITATRAAIPIGQTLPGQIRSIGATGPIMAHAGEIIGRPMGGGFGGGGGFNFTIENFNADVGGNSPLEAGRYFRLVRDALSTDIPLS